MRSYSASFAAHPAAEWVERLRAADILAGPINDFGDVVADPNLTGALPLVETMAPNAPTAVGSPIRMNGAYMQTIRPAPAKAAHTREVLAEMGYGQEEIAAYIDDGAVFTLNDAS